MKIIKQLRTTPCVQVKSRGFWKDHYTMTLWNNHEEMKQFSVSGAHLEAMKSSKNIAQEIRTTTLESDKFPSWKEAIHLLESGKVIHY